jgi:excisionase family DNA binding protein
MSKILMRPVEVAEALGLGRSTVYGLLARGAIPSIRVGGQLRVPAVDLDAWVRSQVGKGASQVGGEGSGDSPQLTTVDGVQRKPEIGVER